VGSILSLELLQNVITRLLASDDMPHGLGEVDIILKLDLLIQLLLGQRMELAVLARLKLFIARLASLLLLSVVHGRESGMA